MLQRTWRRTTRAGRRFGAGRFSLARVLTALVVVAAMFVGSSGIGRGAHCARRNAESASIVSHQASSVRDAHGAAPVQQAPAQDDGVPSPLQGCASATALPVVAAVPTAGLRPHGLPLERVAVLVTSRESSTLFRPPRVA